jgi:hypothetical protein
MRRRRMPGAVLTAMAAVLLVTESAFAALKWAPVENVTDTFTFNTEQSLARTVTSSTSFLHAVYTDTKIGAVLVSDGGPRAGVYYQRGNSKGKSWGNTKRLNPKSKHATSSAIVASGSVLYGAYVSIGHWIAYDPAEPRPITVRINSNHGGKNAWLDRKLHSTETRVDRPALAPWSTRGLLMAFTNADTGEIVLYTCGDLTVAENGCIAAIVGTTTRVSPFEADDGFEGLPVVAAVGDDIAVAWLETDDGGISYITKDGEAEWTAPAQLTTELADSLSIAGRDTRFAFAWAEPTGIKARLLNAGTLDPTRDIQPVSSGATYRQAYSTSIALAGTTTIGVAYAACRRSDCNASSNTGVDLRWRESVDNGATWPISQSLALYSAGSSRRINEFPSVVMSSTTKRFVMFNSTSASASTFRVKIRVGSG